MASGEGTILQALIDARICVSVVLVDRPDIGVIRRAEIAGVPVVLVDRSAFMPAKQDITDANRAAFTESVIDALKRFEIDVVALAGFMTILSPQFARTFPNRVLNTHPSLLPAFRGTYGENTIQATLDAGVKLTGCTVHIATEDVDDGPILAQVGVPVIEGDTVVSLHERIKEAERHIYPKILREFLAKVEA